jgi:hypothetical protein
MIILKDLKTRRDVRMSQATADGLGHIFVKVGTETLTYEVALDMHQISVMATKAAGSRKGRSKSGPVIVRITKREPVPQETPKPYPNPAQMYEQGRKILADLDAGKEPKQ